MTSGWKPILSGSNAAAAEQSILQIADALRDWSPDRNEYGLAGGAAGVAIFYHALSEHWPDSEFRELRDRYWNKAIDMLADAPYAPPNLYVGFTGVGWATAFLSSSSGVAGRDDDLHQEIEEALLDCVASFEDPFDYDLINGVTGWGLYALERWPSLRATRALELIVDLFDQRAERVPEGVRWHTAPELLPEWQRKDSPRGYYNLGLSHGMPGVWVLLAQALVRGIRPEVSKALLEGAVHWVLSQKAQGSYLFFPSAVNDEPQEPGTRLAWCYGDLGVSAALFVTGQVTQREEWMREARSIARRACALSQKTSRNRDAGLCHGAAGVGHIFNRFYQTTGEEAFSAAGIYWLRVALAMRREGIGPGNYGAWRQDPPGWVPMAGALEGSAGIGLALLAGISDHEAHWDRFLSVSPVPMTRVQAHVPEDLAPG